jgi:hypothetical protein
MLALVIGIRKVISGTEEPPVTEILKTNILSMVA